jgi:hypothetical protein
MVYPLVGAEVLSEEFLGWCDMRVGFRAASYRARGQKPGVSSGQLAGEESPVNGNFDYDPGGIVWYTLIT